MNLKEYMYEYMVVQKYFADRLGVNAATIHNLKHGKTQPSLKLAIDIEKLTKGEVSVYSWGNEEKVAIKKEAKAKIEKTINIKKKKKILNSSSRLSASKSSLKTSRIK